MSAQIEQWRVSTIDGVYETDLETLKQWIAEGAVSATDKVSKGKLNWIDAGRAPNLKAAFAGEHLAPAVPQSVQPSPAENTWQEAVPESYGPGGHDDATPALHTFDSPSELPAACYNHPQDIPYYVCPSCATGLCQACAKFLDAHRIATCPLCGEFCKVFEEVKARADGIAFQSSGFGLDDFVRAIRYPLQHKVALLSGALIYGVLRLGGLRGSVIAFVIMFGCMSHVISQLAWGRLNRSFMPDFSEFSPWDDLVVPIFLGLGITIVSWGPVIVLMAALFFGMLNAGPNVLSLNSGQAEAAQRSGPPTPADLAPLTDPNADSKQLEEANQKLNQLRPGAQIAEEAERSKKANSDNNPALSAILPFLGAGILIVVLLLVGLAWAIFYYPMALAVAGYTQSFSAVINPMVGLDTIRRMGAIYFKAFGMVLLVQAVGLVISKMVFAVTSPLALPFFGNLPATFIDGTISFYLNLVISCVLGLSLFKCGDRLGINVY
jgi:hypothetical protein